MMGRVVEQGTAPFGFPGAVVRWWVSVGREVAQAPETVARLRQLLEAMAGLPLQLERVVGSVEGITVPLSGSLEDVARALAEIRDRLDHLDSVIWHLRDTLVAVIAAVPGAGRVLDRLPPPPPPASSVRSPGAPSLSPSSPAEPPGNGEGRR